MALIGRLRARRAPEAAELAGPFRGPERFALTMPLLAAPALALVVSAAATGQSSRVVATLAVGGLGLCAAAPMALIELYVGRPLRVALAHLRAARDGEAAPSAAPPAGIIGDLVAVARDIRAGQSQTEPFQAALTSCETLIAASDEAIRAFRLHGEELADAGASSRRSHLAEIAEALRALSANAPAAGLDGATERVEQMLVYLAESLERGEARDHRADEAFARVEQSLADLARPAARAAPDLGRIVEAIRADSETTRRALRERVEQTLQPLLERGETSRRVSEETLPAMLAALERAVGKLDAAAETIKTSRDAAGSREDLRGLAQSVGRIGEEMARMQANAPGAALDSLRDEARASAAGLAQEFSRLGARLQDAAARRGDEASAAAKAIGETVARGLAEIGERLGAEAEAQAGRLDDVGSRVVERLLAVERDANSTTLTALLRCTGRLDHAIDRLDVLSASAAGLASTQMDDLRAEVRALAAEAATAARRLDAAFAAGSAAADAASAKLHVKLDLKLDGLATRLEALAHGAFTPDGAAQAPAEPDRLPRALGERLDALEARLTSDAAWGRESAAPTVDAAELASEFLQRFAAFAEEQAARVEHPASAARFAETSVALGLRFDAFAAAQSERLRSLDLRLANRGMTLDRTVVAAAVTAFRDTTRRLATAVDQVQGAAAAIEGHAAQAGSRDEAALRALTSTLAGHGERLETLARAQDSRLDALELRIASRTSADRDAVASSLSAYRALGVTLEEAAAKFAPAAQTAER